MDLYADDIKERLFVEVYNAKKAGRKIKKMWFMNAGRIWC